MDLEIGEQFLMVIFSNGIVIFTGSISSDFGWFVQAMASRIFFFDNDGRFTGLYNIYIGIRRYCRWDVHNIILYTRTQPHDHHFIL